MERLEHNFASLIDFTSRNLRRFSTAKLRRLGLTVDQWGSLKLLEENGGRMGFGEMSERLLRDKATLTRIVDILVRDGLVRRLRDREDRRRILVELTDPGREKTREASRLVRDLREQVSEGLTEGDREALRTILGKLNKNIATQRA